MLQLFDAIDQAYQERKENLTPEIDQLKSQQKWSSDRVYHNLKDQIEKNQNAIKALERRENFNTLIQKTQDALSDMFAMEEIADKIQTFVLHSPRGLRSLTSLYDKPKYAKRMIRHFSQYSIEQIEELAKMPELPSITSMLSGRGLCCSLEEIKQCIFKIKELWLNIQTVATAYSNRCDCIFKAGTSFWCTAPSSKNSLELVINKKRLKSDF